MPVSADRAISHGSHTRAKSRGSQPRRAISRERRTVCWREPDSNHRYRSHERVFRLLPEWRCRTHKSSMGKLSTGRLAKRRWLGAGPLSQAVSLTAGPMVRIRLPPAVSLRTIGSAIGRIQPSLEPYKRLPSMLWCSSVRASTRLSSDHLRQKAAPSRRRSPVSPPEFGRK